MACYRDSFTLFFLLLCAVMAGAREPSAEWVFTSSRRSLLQAIKLYVFRSQFFYFGLMRSNSCSVRDVTTFCSAYLEILSSWRNICGDPAVDGTPLCGLVAQSVTRLTQSLSPETCFERNVAKESELTCRVLPSHKTVHLYLHRN
jgi:hypothetical protein